ncbi:MAG: hypothetical protein ABR529_02490 [Actinomycetota bacterium]
MAIALVALLGAAALIYVGMPLLGGRRGPRPALDAPGPEASAAGEGARKRSALDAILDLEADHDMGKLTEDDFQALLPGLEAEALEALRRLDALRAPDDDLEREIAAITARLQCPGCGAPRPTGSVCPRCGEGSTSRTR